MENKREKEMSPTELADQSETDAASLHAIIAGNEAWLIDRILFYAKRQGYARYTSTLREAWRQSIAGLSAPLLAVLEKGLPDVELNPDEDFTGDPLACFGITEAHRHLKRGVNQAMFLGLMKYYRQSYLDLIDRRSPDPASGRPLFPHPESVFRPHRNGFDDRLDRTG